MLFSHKNYLVHVNKVEENGTVLTPSGSLPVFVGDVLLTDEYGNTTVTNKKYVNENFVAVEKVTSKPRKRKMSPFEQEEFARHLMEFGSLENNIEDQDYIDGQREFMRNKAF